MHLCHFAFFEKPDEPGARIAAEDLAMIRACMKDLDGLSKAQLCTPATAHDINVDDGSGPFFGMQLFFETIENLERAVGPAVSTIRC